MCISSSFFLDFRFLCGFVIRSSRDGVLEVGRLDSRYFFFIESGSGVRD